MFGPRNTDLPPQVFVRASRRSVAYTRARRTQINPVPRFEGFYERIPFSGCWIWLGAIQSKGYGNFTLNGRSVLPHRFAYEQERGPIPKGKELDHLCRVRCCVNPAHLEAVEHRVNVQRGVRPVVTHCKHGHEFTDENTYLHRGCRHCRACNDLAVKRYRESKWTNCRLN